MRLETGWDIKRSLARINYKIHTDAIKEVIVPQTITLQQAVITYASEADVLNMALFGMTAKEWRYKNPELTGNIRDYASVEQLVILSNLESLNAVFIRQGLPQKERLLALNEIAITQFRSLSKHGSIKQLK